MEEGPEAQAGAGEGLEDTPALGSEGAAAPPAAKEAKPEPIVLTLNNEEAQVLRGNQIQPSALTVEEWLGALDEALRQRQH